MEEVADSAEWDDGPTFGAANPMVGALRGAAPRRAADSSPNLSLSVWPNG